MTTLRHSLALLIHLSSILLLNSVQCINNSDVSQVIQPRQDDGETNNDRPSVKKWFNNLISPNSDRQGKKSTSSSDRTPHNVTNHGSVHSNSIHDNKSPYPMPVQIYPLPYHQTPYMTFPYSHSDPSYDSRRSLMPLPFPVMSSASHYSKGPHAFYPRNYSPLYMTSPSMYPYDSRSFAYAIPVVNVPYIKSSYYPHNGPVKYRPKGKPRKYRDNQHLEQTSVADSGKEGPGEESRQLEMLSPTFDSSNLMEAEEEYQPTQDYDEDRDVVPDSFE